MIARLLTTVAVIGAVGVVPAERAEANDLIGGVALGVLGTLAVQEANRSRTRSTTTRTTTRAAAPRIPVTEQGKQTQTALNYFGYNAGTVDGQIGPGTRSAIERYQAAMGYPVNGREFTDFQFENLMAAYYWAENGGQQQTGLFGSQLLMAYKSQMGAAAPVMAGAPALGGQPTLGGQQPVLGGAQPPALGGQAPALGTGQPVLAATGAGTATPPALGGAPALQQTSPAATAAAATAPSSTGLPNFMATGEAQSLASHCNTVSLLTGSNGGFTRADQITDPDFALSEQFCLARTYAIETGQELAASVQGVSAQQIESQCGAFGSALAGPIISLGSKERDAVLQEVNGFILNSGLQPSDLAGTSRICLGVGYRTDDMAVALGSGLVLAALGERAYGELMGHHLSQGFGVSKNPSQARPWYEMGLEAAESQALFAPGQPERTDVIRAAVTGEAPAAAPVVPAASDGNALPSFTVKQ